jgi:hypothetical protein
MKTLALVLGNNNYDEGAKLKNAVNDATSIKDVFERLDFDVLFYTDFSRKTTFEFLEVFDNKIQDYDATIFYFAGHGFELKGENYLAPIDTQIPPQNEYEAGSTCIRLNEILDTIKKHPRKIHIVIIDACRQKFGRGGNVGFSTIQAPKGTLIAFSTSPDESASDTGYIDHSVYTGALLQYIGRERLSVEDLFKKVRKTVYDLTDGRQTTWEHTSLIGDYYFNEGQMVYQINIPYDEKVVKDAYYDNISDEFGKLIMSVKSYNWYVQNPAIDQLLRISANQLDKNQQFILGRNLLQAADGNAASANKFFTENLQNKITKYNENNENHLLNGILFEIYFNSYGDFRENKVKQSCCFDEIMNLRKLPELKKSFDFICKLLLSTQYQLIYIPQENNDVLDINVVATEKEATEAWTKERYKYQEISAITFNNNDITKQIAKIHNGGVNEKGVIKEIALFLSAPDSLIKIHSNINLTKTVFTNEHFGDKFDI